MNWRITAKTDNYESNIQITIRECGLTFSAASADRMMTIIVNQLSRDIKADMVFVRAIEDRMNVGLPPEEKD